MWRRPQNWPDGSVQAQENDDPGFKRLSDPLEGLTRQQKAAFEERLEVFEREFVEADGLGPLFNSESCVSCHGRVRAPDGTFARGKDGGSGFIPARQMSAWDGATCDHLVELGGPGYQSTLTNALALQLGLPIPPDDDPGPEPTPTVSTGGIPVGPLDRRPRMTCSV